jgi:DNA-binding beta-propeller fold protein YncE
MKSLILFLLLFVAGCSQVYPKKTPVIDPRLGAKVWPAPPEIPRYAYAATLTGERDFIDKAPKQNKSDSTRLMEWVTGFVFGDPNFVDLGRPASGMVDNQGRILVTDVAHKAVMVFDMKNKKLLKWTKASDDDNFQAPIGICEDGSGGFFVTDSDLGSVYRLSADGRPLSNFGHDVLDRPTGIVRDPASGDLFVADTSAHVIKVFRSTGELIEIIGARGSKPEMFNYPTLLDLHDGHLYITDTLNFRIQVSDLAGHGKLTFGQIGLFVGNLTRPKGVSVGDDGRIYVVESYYDHLLVFDKSGQLLLPIGGTGVAEGRFYLPAGVWTDKEGRVYVADMFNGRISIFKELEVKG